MEELEYTGLVMCPHRKKSHAVKSGDFDVHCHWKEQLLLFEKCNWLYTLQLFSNARVHHPVSTAFSETVHLEINVGTIKLTKEEFPCLLSPNMNLQSQKETSKYLTVTT